MTRHQTKMLKKYDLFLDDDSRLKPIDTEFVYPAKDILEHLGSSPRTACRIVSLFSSFLNGPILEVGGGVGQITNELMRVHSAVTVLEPDVDLYSNLVDKFSQYPTISVSNSSINTFQNKTLFGSAVYVNVLEHIANDRGELISANRTLLPGGTVVIFSPALPFLYGSLDGLSGHFRRYRKKELISVVKDAGFEVVHDEYFDPIGILPYLFMYRLLRIRSIGSGGMFIYDHAILPLSTLFSKMVGKRIIGKNLLVVGQKSDQT